MKFKRSNTRDLVSFDEVHMHFVIGVPSRETHMRINMQMSLFCF